MISKKVIKSLELIASVMSAPDKRKTLVEWLSSLKSGGTGITASLSEIIYVER
jgi:hypothetical protein